jgi:hypothetical protein
MSSSAFESDVYQARQEMPWAEIDLKYFLKILAQDTYDVPQPVSLSVVSRPSVSTRFWWVLTWFGEDGEERTMAAATLELCLWRAAVREKQLRDKAERRNVPGSEGVS